MRGIQMNQTTLTISCVFLTSILSTLGSNWQANKARDDAESNAINVLSSKFAGVESSVEKFGAQMGTITNTQSVLKTKVEALEEFKKDASTRLRHLESK